ncbi:MAG: hypothetical protein IKZ62_08880 [Prevotella sp.]|nr:hypothetical protein [Prevotella sp.]
MRVAGLRGCRCESLYELYEAYRNSSVKGTIEIEPTNGEWKQLSIDLTEEITGVQDLFFTFTGSGSSLFDFDNWQFCSENTGIVELNNSWQAKRAKDTITKIEELKYYDLQGRRVENPKKGVYIQKGKKVVIK